MYWLPVVSVGLKWHRMSVRRTSCPVYFMTEQSIGCFLVLLLGYLSVLFTNRVNMPVLLHILDDLPTYSRSETNHTICLSLVDNLDCCAYIANPIIAIFGPSHWRWRNDHLLLQRHKWYLPCVLSEPQKDPAIHPTTFDPCVRFLSIAYKEDVLLTSTTYQTFKKLSSEALTSMFPAVSAQQQLLISSSWAKIFTVRLLAKRS